MKTQKRNLKLKKSVVSKLTQSQALQLVGGYDDEGGDGGSVPPADPRSVHSGCWFCG